jgi:plastocyanin
MDGTPRQDRHPRTASVLLTRAGALALAAGLLAACGGNDDGGGTSAPAGGAATSATSTTAAGGTDDAMTSSMSSAGGTATGEEDGSQASAEEVVITIEDFSFDVPDSVPPGADILVRNLDGVGHTVTADQGGTFDVAVGPGEEVTFTAPSQAGEYPFHCTPHPAMTSTLVVKGDGS